MSSLKRSLIQLHVFVFLAGLTAPLGNLIQLNGLYIVFYRILLTVLALFPIYFFHRQPNKVSLKEKGWLMLIGVLISIHWVCFYGSIKLANVSVALVAMSTGALFTSIIEPIFFKRKLIILELFFGLIVISGLYLIFNFETEYTLGIIYALIAAFLSAVFTVLNGLYIKEHDAEVISIYQLFFGVLFRCEITAN